MEISRESLLREAEDMGFEPAILEKVWRLMGILDEINIHPFLKERLVLKGGTALNLFVFELPRLSVDIDLNYIGSWDREIMMNERPQVEKALEQIFHREGLTVRRIPDRHAGGKWRLQYKSHLHPLITICWPNGIDLCPDVLYRTGKDVKRSRQRVKKPSRGIKIRRKPKVKTT